MSALRDQPRTPASAPRSARRSGPFAVLGRLDRRAAWLLGLVTAVAACSGAGVALFDEDRATSSAPIRSGAGEEEMRGELADAQRALREGDAAAAEKLLAAWLDKHPESWTAHYHLGLVHMDAGRFEPARIHLERAVKLQPELYGAWSNLGVLYMEHGEDVAALRSLDKAAALAPKDVRILVNLGNARSRRGLWSEAIEAYEAALAEAPGHGTALYDLGLAWAARQRWDKALAAADKAIVYRPGFAHARALRVVALTHLGQLDTAISDGEADLDRIAPVVENHVALGRALLIAGRKDDAIERLRAAVKVDADSPLARMTLGEVLDATGDKAGASAHYEAYLKLPKRRFEDARRLRHRLRELKAGDAG